MVELTDEWLDRLGEYIQFIHAKGSKHTGPGRLNRIPFFVFFLY